MFILSYDFLSNEVDEKIELLQFNDIFDVFYENPLEITTDEFGYGYLEKDNAPVILKVAYNDDKSNLDDFINLVSTVLEKKMTNIEEINYTYEDFSIPPISLDDNWMLIDPLYSDEFEENKKMFFKPQGAFGTGLHETTHDILNYILKKDFSNKTVLDIGTGSGILSIATALKNAKEVVALDIRDVTEEVVLNANLNNLSNISVKVGDALNEDLIHNTDFDYIYINIGGEETEFFMDFINSHLKPSGTLLVSGLVTWSYEKIKNMILSNGYTTLEEFSTNEWCTSTFQKKA
ncbi:50S ribosomal protein L11 methyltransferase [uncultured Clostridium sp.]|uniref:50S ribosomal protein L11 methyltransferase n=1 Tax=uncultured Clostridium sp. TaxID=59620 RepID=UPI002616F276|nr:50S ribosomal protein L11 methyltransferase [uncultured Clostridium sp.]